VDWLYEPFMMPLTGTTSHTPGIGTWVLRQLPSSLLIAVRCHPYPVSCGGALMNSQSFAMTNASNTGAASPLRYFLAQPLPLRRSERIEYPDCQLRQLPTQYWHHALSVGWYRVSIFDPLRQQLCDDQYPGTMGHQRRRDLLQHHSIGYVEQHDDQSRGSKYRLPAECVQHLLVWLTHGYLRVQHDVGSRRLCHCASVQFLQLLPRQAAVISPHPAR